MSVRAAVVPAGEPVPTVTVSAATAGKPVGVVPVSAASAGGRAGSGGTPVRAAGVSVGEPEPVGIATGAMTGAEATASVRKPVGGRAGSGGMSVRAAAVTAGGPEPAVNATAETVRETAPEVAGSPVPAARTAPPGTRKGEVAAARTAGACPSGDGGPLLLGVRHHGPGSARAVAAALAAAAPEAVLIEGPPEGDALLALAADEGLRPPVALLAHAVDDPGRAAFWPFAEFSPEWVAIRWALANDVPVRFIDLPAAHSLALCGEPKPGADGGTGTPDEPEGTDSTADTDTTGTGAEAAPDAVPGGSASGPAEDGGPVLVPVPDPAAEPGSPESEDADPDRMRIDPLAALAEAAGYDDPERWWEDVVEHRGSDDPFAAFTALAEAMAALRETYGHGGHERDLVREAHMRLRLRAARKEFGDRIAVVCGAWHVPALAEKTTITADKALLKGLPKVRTETTWVPWTHRRLARGSGYGAGIDSPGWYGHLFSAPDRPVERWLTKVAGLLRDEDMGVSSAHVIEAVRLAGTLAVMRGRPLPGLTETTDAIRAVMCDGSDVPLELVRDRLIVGDVLGEVPDSAPAVPLQRDLTRLQRSLRLKPEALERTLELDLRKDTDTAKSRLLHRLRLLGVDWGVPAAGRTGTGTFRETWRLRWEPELHVKIAEAGVWGTTVLAAATARAEHDAAVATELSAITVLAEQCLLAELTDALPVVMRTLADRAALDSDVAHLAEALPALARALRYGDVRTTDTAALAGVATGLADRICVGLPPACAGLDADGAAAMRERLDSVHTAIGLLPGAGDLPDRWRDVLGVLAARDTVAGVIRGRAARLLLDDGELAEDEAARLMALALSPGTPPPDAAAWIEGFVGGASGGGMLLLHDERLLGLVDDWLTGVHPDAFTDVLPLLRRTFSAYEPGLRRTLGELVRRGAGTGVRAAAAGSAADTAAVPGFGPGLDQDRADAVLPVLRLLLGAPDDRSVHLQEVAT
ncbi:DUF5682 family protein [Streptomyces sp. NPDC020875]|uniref:DUF5682 family protein n=1 Tax=Streptomyces sp. NPDC020875 TaxID=3154898 RepID=UPI0033C6F635